MSLQDFISIPILLVSFFVFVLFSPRDHIYMCPPHMWLMVFFFLFEFRKQTQTLGIRMKRDLKTTTTTTETKLKIIPLILVIKHKMFDLEFSFLSTIPTQHFGFFQTMKRIGMKSSSISLYHFFLFLFFFFSRF